VAQLKVVFCPPRDSQSRAGLHPIYLSVTTQGEPQMRRMTAAQLTIERFEKLEATLEPEEIAKPKGEFQLDLHNSGNEGAVVSLEIDGDGLVYQSDRQQVEVNNGAWDRIRVVAKVKRRHWLGTDRQYSFSVTAAAGEERVVRRGRLACPPRIPLWLQGAYRRIQSVLVPIMILIALLGGAFAFARPPDIKDFKAEPSSVILGEPVTLSWSLERASGVTIEPASGTEQLGIRTGTLTVTPTASLKYTLAARNWVGIPSSRSVNVEVKPAPVLPKIKAFTASPERLKKEGEAVTLRWETEDASKVAIEPADEVKDPKTSGEAIVHPSKNNVTYKLTATNAAGSGEATKTILIDAPQVASFVASPDTVSAGGEVKLRWSALGATKIAVKANKGEVAQGKQELELQPTATDLAVRPLEETEYTLTATNAGGSDAKTVTVKVKATGIAFFRAEPASIAKGEAAMLTWKVDGATAITIQPGVGAVDPEQTSALVKPTEDTEYTLTATGADGKQVQKKAKVTVGLGPVKIDFFSAAPTSIAKGEQAILTYSVQNAKRIVITASDGTVVRSVSVSQPSVKQSVNVAPDKTTIYTLTASNDSGESALPATVQVK
jgi:PKD repeat protein